MEDISSPRNTFKGDALSTKTFHVAAGDVGRVNFDSISRLDDEPEDAERPLLKGVPRM